MSRGNVAIVGSGIVGSVIAYLLSSKGYDVDVFEKGPDYPYPHSKQFSEEIQYLYQNPLYRLPENIKNITVSGDYPMLLNNELFMNVGGSATQWEAIALRMIQNDFKTKSLYNYGQDWPITYNDLEPYYCEVETLLGVSGTDADNPYAPPRSQPYPLPPFEMSYDDRLLAERLKEAGIVLHTVPQARTSNDYQDREGCVNYGTCFVCPIGARYSPNYHLDLAIKTGRCKLHVNVAVKRIVVGKLGRAESVIYSTGNSLETKEHGAKLIIVAAGAIESARLLLLSKGNSYPDGIGNSSGHLGQHLVFHHLWSGPLHYKDALFPGRIGPHTGQSHQFIDPPERGRHGGIKVEFSSRYPFEWEEISKVRKYLMKGSDIVKGMEKMRHGRIITLHAESLDSPEKYISLSEEKDRFGDPFAHVQYKSNGFDYETHNYAQTLFNRFAEATGAEKAEFADADNYRSGAHHMGTVRMGHNISNSVVDPFCRIHGSPNLFVIGGGNFVGSASVNPTLTITALAVRAAHYIKDQRI